MSEEVSEEVSKEVGEDVSEEKRVSDRRCSSVRALGRNALPCWQLGVSFPNTDFPAANYMLSNTEGMSRVGTDGANNWNCEKPLMPELAAGETVLHRNPKTQIRPENIVQLTGNRRASRLLSRNTERVLHHHHHHRTRTRPNFPSIHREEWVPDC